MVKPQSCEKTYLRKGAWSPEEDKKLVAYISRYGIWNWTRMPKPAGLLRTGKSCRLRWMNYLRPDIKHGNFSEEEEQIIMKLHQELGNRWSTIAARLPGRTDNEIKNYWHTRLSKKRLSNKPVPTTSLQETETAQIETNLKNPSELDSLPPAPEVSKFDGCKASPMSPQLSTDDYSSSSSDPSFRIYEDQITEKNIGPSETYQLQSFLVKSFPMEGLYMMEGFGAIVPGPILPTSWTSYSNEVLQGLLEQQFPVKDLGVVESDKAKDPGFILPPSQGGFSTEEFQRSLEQTFPMEGLDMVKRHGAAEPGGMISNPQAGYLNEELQSLLEQSFPIESPPMEGLGMVKRHGAAESGGMISNPQAGYLNEELQSLLKQSFPIESPYEVEDYGAFTYPGVEVSYSQWGLQGDPYSCASNHDTGNDFWPYFLMEANDDGI